MPVAKEDVEEAGWDSECEFDLKFAHCQQETGKQLRHFVVYHKKRNRKK